MANRKLRKAPEGKKGKGLRKLPKKVRNKMGFMKEGGLAEATAKLKAQGLKDGGMKIVRGTARGGGAATKGLGYNERPN
jgi:hypothetical protein